MPRRRRTPLLLLLALPLVLVVVVVAEIVIVLGRDHLTESDFEIDFTTEGEQPAIRMAFLGDSLVEGVGASGPREALAGQVARKVSDETGRAVDLVGFGVSGAITADVVRDQLGEVDAGRFDVIVIEIGSNDVTHATSLDSVERSTRTMLEQATDRASIVVFGSAGKLNSRNFLPPLRQLMMARATQVRERQREVADELGVAFMDVSKSVSPTYDAAADATSEDEFHPGDVGYEIWARPLAELVVEELEASESPA
jgi:lysophospholipase L1-like esterase